MWPFSFAFFDIVMIARVRFCKGLEIKKLYALNFGKRVTMLSLAVGLVYLIGTSAGRIWLRNQREQEA